MSGVFMREGEPGSWRLKIKIKPSVALGYSRVRVFRQLLGEVAGGEVTGGDFAQRRLLGAFFPGEGTARAKYAAFGPLYLRAGISYRLSRPRVRIGNGDG